MRFLLLFFAFSLVASARASLPGLAQFTGTLQGKTEISGLPPLTWTLVAHPLQDGAKKAVLSCAGDGLVLHVQLDANVTQATIAWRIVEGRLALGPWLTALAPRFAPSLTAASADGELRVNGSGTLDPSLRPLGRLSVSCVDASLQNPLEGWTLAGISLGGDFTLGPGFEFTSVGSAALGIQTISTTRFGARALALTGELRNNRELLVTRAHVEIAGGEVETRQPFTVPLSPLAIDTLVSIRRVGLQDFVALIPSGLSSARGKLNGDLRVTWSATEELQIGAGFLALDEAEPTVIRLAASPGFLTGSMPERIAPFPGFLGRLFSFANPSVKDLRDIELGVAELEVSSLRVRLTPEGDSRGRTAHVEVDARPLQRRGVVKRVTFNINVDGPFSSLLRLGLNEPFSVELR